MCGRYTLYTESYSWSDFHWPLEDGFVWEPSYNIAPTAVAPVVPNAARPTVMRFRWGLVPPWSKNLASAHRMTNARAETLAERPAFRVPFRHRRCLVLADGFYEWKREKGGSIPYYITHRSGKTLAFAGLWDEWKQPDGNLLKTFTIATVAANALLAPIHDRMPVILPPGSLERWITPEPVEPGTLADVMIPYAGSDLIAFPVSKTVNSVAHNSPECVRPLS
jgi:putative SOS response-associated peptidase YedK